MTPSSSRCSTWAASSSAPNRRWLKPPMAAAYWSCLPPEDAERFLEPIGSLRQLHGRATAAHQRIGEGEPRHVQSSRRAEPGARRMIGLVRRSQAVRSSAGAPGHETVDGTAERRAALARTELVNVRPAAREVDADGDADAHLARPVRRDRPAVRGHAPLSVRRGSSARSPDKTGAAIHRETGPLWRQAGASRREGLADVVAALPMTAYTSARAATRGRYRRYPSRQRPSSRGRRRCIGTRTTASRGCHMSAAQHTITLGNGVSCPRSAAAPSRRSVTSPTASSAPTARPTGECVRGRPAKSRPARTRHRGAFRGRHDGDREHVPSRPQDQVRELVEHFSAGSIATRTPAKVRRGRPWQDGPPDQLERTSRSFAANSSGLPGSCPYSPPMKPPWPPGKMATLLPRRSAAA